MAQAAVARPAASTAMAQAVVARPAASTAMAQARVLASPAASIAMADSPVARQHPVRPFRFGPCSAALLSREAQWEPKSQALSLAALLRVESARLAARESTAALSPAAAMAWRLPWQPPSEAPRRPA
jgi:hypothetical protein